MKTIDCWIQSMYTFWTHKTYDGHKFQFEKMSMDFRYNIQRCHSSDTVTHRLHMTTKCICRFASTYFKIDCALNLILLYYALKGGAGGTMRRVATSCSALTLTRCDGQSQRWLVTFRVSVMDTVLASSTILCTYLAVSKRKSTNSRAMYTNWTWRQCTGHTCGLRDNRPAIETFIRLRFWIIECTFLVAEVIHTVHIIHRKRFTALKSSIWIWKHANGKANIQHSIQNRPMLNLNSFEIKQETSQYNRCNSTRSTKSFGICIQKFTIHFRWL